MSKSAVTIEQTISGWEVLELRPVVVGRFSERTHADLFADALRFGAKERAASAEPLQPNPGAPDEVDTPQIAPVLQPAEPNPTAAKSKAPAQPSVIEKSPPEVLPGVVSETPLEEISDDDLSTAFDRAEGGEKMMTIARDMGLPFGRLRAKWAAAVKSGARQKPDDDQPTSGGPAGVLARGHKAASEWNDEIDRRLIEARPEDLSAIAADIGKSISIVQARKAALEAQVTKLMGD